MPRHCCTATARAGRAWARADGDDRAIAENPARRASAGMADEPTRDESLLSIAIDMFCLCVVRSVLLGGQVSPHHWLKADMYCGKGSGSLDA